MAKYIFEGGYKNRSGYIKVRLFIVHFVDENNIHFIYSPHLDLTGYGINIDEAKKSFKIVLKDFVDYTLKKKTFGKVLIDLGWVLKGSENRPDKVFTPSITSVIKENDYVSEIFDKYPVDTYHQEVGIPVFA